MPYHNARIGLRSQSMDRGREKGARTQGPPSQAVYRMPGCRWAGGAGARSTQKGRGGRPHEGAAGLLRQMADQA